MASRSHVVLNRTPAVRRSVGGTSNQSLNQKRKASVFSEDSMLGVIQSAGDFASGMQRMSKDKAAQIEDHNGEQHGFAAAQSPRRKIRKGEPPEEKRLRVFRKHAPQSFLERLERARSQRMFLIDRQRKFNVESNTEEEVFDIAGTTGNMYQVEIGRMPHCNCPDAKKGNHCKHIIYILVNVLKVPEHLAYQLAFLSSELTTIFAQAPSAPHPSQEGSSTDSVGDNRKPIEGDCPVCVMEFDAETEEIVWCKAACGNNIHKECFERWAASKAGQVKCVYCRTLWKGDEESVKRICKMGERNQEGYVNVANELGLSGERSYSTYHQPWVRDRIYGGWPY